ncbi:MAG: c-type cytochrome [candidate division Zixibacteria bacterium]
MKSGENFGKRISSFIALRLLKVASRNMPQTSLCERRSSIFFAIVFFLISFTSIGAQDMAGFFGKNCKSCHTIGGGKLIGPDLKDVSERKDRDWLIRFIVDPVAMIKAGDPYALKLQTEANGVIMTPIAGITKEQAGLILDFVESESKLEVSEFAKNIFSEEPTEETDPILGNKLFNGEEHLNNGGPSCISCHTGAGPDIGGSLGPDLNLIFQRLQGRRAISAWLSAPPTPTMGTVFEKHPLEPDEIRLLVDLFEAWENLDRSYNHDSFIIWMTVIFYGLGGAVVSLVVFGGIWERRFRSVRRPLVNNAKARGKF